MFADSLPGYPVLEAVAMVGSRRLATAALEYTLEPVELEMDAGRHAERLRALAPALRQVPVATRARDDA